MGLFSSKKDDKSDSKARIAAIIESSAEAITRIHMAGRYPLSIVVLGIAVIIVALIVWKFVATVGDIMPWLLVFASFLSVLGVVIYIVELRKNHRLIERSLDQYHDLVARAFDKYLMSYEKIDGLQWKGILEQLDQIYSKYSQVDSSKTIEAPIQK